MNKEIMTIDNNNYYIKNKNKYGKQFSSLVDIVKKLISPVYSPEIVEDVLEKAQNEFDNILASLPYVGGDKSPFTSLMIQSAVTIAFYKACKTFDMSHYEMGKLIYEIAENSSQSISPFKKWLYRKAILSKKMKNEWRYWLKESQKDDYSESWVGDFIEGDGTNFDYGFNFTECGWLKLIEKEGIRDVAPYACLCDYARMRAIGIGFKRTKTLAAGEDFCDFRFAKNYETPRGWPPEDLEENKDFYANLKK